MKDTHPQRPVQDPAALVSLIPGKRPSLFAVRLNTFPVPRFIGELEGNTYRKRIHSGPHTLHNAGAIGINAAVLTHPDIPVKWIAVDVDGTKLVTSKRFLLANGHPFKYRNYEPQFALPLDLWGVDKARAWEEEEDKRERQRRERAAQGNLFEEAAA
jgi:hypothetical protein